jgi:hypothetical protein
VVLVLSVTIEPCNENVKDNTSHDQKFSSTLMPRTTIHAEWFLTNA